MYVINNPIMRADPSGYYPSGMPSDIQKIVKKREDKKKSEQYIKRYGGSQAVKNAKASRANTVRKAPIGSGDNNNPGHSTGNLIANPFPVGPAMITMDVYTCMKQTYEGKDAAILHLNSYEDDIIAEMAMMFQSHYKGKAATELDSENASYYKFDKYSTISGYYKRLREKLNAKEDLLKYKERHEDILRVERETYPDFEDSEQPTVYYKDFSIYGIGKTRLIDVENNTVTDYYHAGYSIDLKKLLSKDLIKKIGLKSLPIPIKISRGTVKGDFSKHTNYNGLFLDLSIIPFIGFEKSFGSKSETTDERMQQQGGGIQGDWAPSIGVSYFWDSEHYELK